MTNTEDAAQIVWKTATTEQELQARCKALEAENALLHWQIDDIRRIMDRLPRNSLPRSTRLKTWGRQTVIEMITRTMPRMMVIWGGAAVVAYLVTFHF